MSQITLALAPLEGITGYVYRNAYHKYYDGVDTYMTPFLSPTGKRKLRSREYNDVNPGNNENIHVVPQILTKSAADFIYTANFLCQEYGYEEVNLNLGCPSGTVVTKGKGAGLLDKPEYLHQMLEEIFRGCSGKISIKTRLGMYEEGEFDRLIPIFNEYPIEKLIIHPRTREDYYRGKPKILYLKEVLSQIKAPVWYNGDVMTKTDYEQVIATLPGIQGVMLGRGILTNPALPSEIMGEQSKGLSTYGDFHNEVLAGYEEIMSGDRNVLFKMKELWEYQSRRLVNREKVLKKIRKSQTVSQYKGIVTELFAREEYWL